MKFLYNCKTEYLYFVLSILILLPLISLGYIQTFDMAWGPIFKPHDITSNTYLLTFFIFFVAAILPSWLVQKLILFSIFFLAGLGGHKLAQLNNKSFAYLAGMVYVFNPFVYTRFINGQWLVLLGYAFLPWAIRAFYIYLKNPNLVNAIKFTIWTSLICLSSIHTIGILLLVLIILFVLIKKKNLTNLFKGLVLITTAILIINSYWLIPVLKGESNLIQRVESFNQNEFNAFATQGTVLNSPVISSLLLTGFWADNQSRYTLPSATPIWIIGILGVFTLVVTGIFYLVKQKDRLGVALIIGGVISIVLVLGVSTPLTAFITNFLNEFVPFYSGYREPHKWLMLLCIVYAYSAGIGGYILIKFLTNRIKKGEFYIKVITLLIPILFAPTLLFAAVGQLKSSDYPADWYTAKEYLESNSESSTIVVFPWHQYIPISFTGRVVANPARYFFKGNIIVSEDPELKGIPVRSTNELSKYIHEEVLPFTDNLSNLNVKLKEKDIDYVMLLKEGDWNRYEWLNKTDLQVVINNNSLILYKVN